MVHTNIPLTFNHLHPQCKMERASHPIWRLSQSANRSLSFRDVSSKPWANKATQHFLNGILYFPVLFYTIKFVVVCAKADVWLISPPLQWYKITISVPGCLWIFNLFFVCNYNAVYTICLYSLSFHVTIRYVMNGIQGFLMTGHSAKA